MGGHKHVQLHLHEGKNDVGWGEVRRGNNAVKLRSQTLVNGHLESYKQCRDEVSPSSDLQVPHSKATMAVAASRKEGDAMAKIGKSFKRPSTSAKALKKS